MLYSIQTPEFVNIQKLRNRFRQAGNRFLGSLKGLQIRAQYMTSGGGGGGIQQIWSRIRKVKMAHSSSLDDNVSSCSVYYTGVVSYGKNKYRRPSLFAGVGKQLLSLLTVNKQSLLLPLPLFATLGGRQRFCLCQPAKSCLSQPAPKTAWSSLVFLVF